MHYFKCSINVLVSYFDPAHLHRPLQTAGTKEDATSWKAETHCTPHSPVFDSAPGTELSAPSSVITVKTTLAHFFFKRKSVKLLIPSDVPVILQLRRT